jgi:D-alanyl-D-alanine carboxypeptidase
MSWRAVAQTAPALPLAELRAVTAGLPRDMRDGILARPKEFLDLAARLLEVPRELLVLVDKEHALGADYVPSDLVPLGNYSELTANPGVVLRGIVLRDLLEMSRAASLEGVTLPLSSTYRSYATQGVVYSGVVQSQGREAADRVSAQPGKSQHQLGTTIDFGSITDAFASTPAGKWLARRAWEFGFSLSYPDGHETLTGYRYESWHYRYITKEAARMQRVFFRDLQQALLVFFHDYRAELQRLVSTR